MNGEGNYGGQVVCGFDCGPRQTTWTKRLRLRQDSSSSSSSSRLLVWHGRMDASDTQRSAARQWHLKENAPRSRQVDVWVGNEKTEEGGGRGQKDRTPNTLAAIVEYAVRYASESAVFQVYTDGSTACKSAYTR